MKRLVFGYLRGITILCILFFLLVSCQTREKEPAKTQIITNLASAVPDQPGLKILPDGRVTFQIKAPDATKVSLSGDFTLIQNQVQDLKKGDNGVWTLTTEPLPPALYSYWYILDGIPMPDPGIGEIKPGVSTTQSQFEIPGSGREWEKFQNVPHGEVRMIWYYSASLDKTRRMHIYFPPGYDKSKDSYPVFYLFHGGGDTDNAWVYNGRVNMIMDNLLAKGEVKPMIIVMPFSFVLKKGAPNFSENTGLFAKDFFEDIIPYVEKTYRILNGPVNRSIGGLSTANLLTDIAIPNLDKFNYLALTSNGLTDDLIAKYDSLYPGVIDNPGNAKRVKIFIGNGTSAMNYQASKNLIIRMTKRGYDAVFFEDNGVHGWPEFRRDFHDIAPKLFR